ncbi:hypothetical protein [Pseudomonas sp. R151218B TE3479]
MAEGKPEPRYQIGPAPELLQEIGQIMVAYSECERSIFAIFKGVMSLDEQDAYLLVKHANLNAEKMLSIIRVQIQRIKPDCLEGPLCEALEIFKRSIEHRNIVAHWQWALTDGTSGLAFNALKAKPGELLNGRSYELEELKLTAWQLAKAAILLGTVAVSMFEVRRTLPTNPGWSPNYYSNRDKQDELIVQSAIDLVREHLDLMDKSMNQSGPSTS